MAETKGSPARQVHSILATAVSKPDLLDVWRTDPASLGHHGIDVADFDLANIRRFSGLVTKVRHNDLRASLPATFRILDSAGISIEAFAAFAPGAAELRSTGRNSKAAKIAALGEFLDSWLDGTQRLHRIIRDVIRHERTIFELREIAATGPPARSDAQNRAVSAESVAIRCEGVTQYEMSCNPVWAARTIQAGGDVTAAVLEETIYGYCPAGEGEGATVIELDALASFLLDGANGRCRVLDLAEQLRMSGVQVETADVIEAVQALVNIGLLKFAEVDSCA
jgi:hypothetical protein